MSKSFLQQDLVKLFEVFFNVDNINPNWNFFDLGIHSVELIELCQFLSKELGEDLNIFLFYEYPTIQALSKALCRTDKIDSI